MKLELTINDMTCNHCVGTITKTVQALDSNATVLADLQTHKVQIQSTVPETQIRQALIDAGYDPA